ncbi:MAG: MHS family MFS transporter [Armatimonadetes bacterium]|nr:MHS family MFS transporter [Armatimonadota bacterium]
MRPMAETNGGELRKIIVASSGGTLIEWYDFYLFGVLSSIIAVNYFPKDNPTAGYLNTLATFAAGFIVRPFGALVFGRMGDLVGRKHAFMVTLLIMGVSTVAVGLIPTYAQIGIVAPMLLVLLRLIQGLAIGGEYGGATTYVAEHAPSNRKGFYTGFIQTTASLGLLTALLVIVATQQALGESAFKDWGWRLPFYLSGILVVLAILIRSKLRESPLFTQLKESGKAATNPIKESFGNPENRKFVLLALFGATAGQGVVWYTGQFYAHSFLQKVLKLSLVDASWIVCVALILATPFFVLCGHLSDRIGRKPLMMAGCLIAALSYLPIYRAMVSAAGFDPQNPTVQFFKPDYGALVFLVFIQVIFVTMVYGPIAAFLVELFPTKVRYTSMSLPYHIGNGVFGGLVPFIATLIVARTGSIYAGLFYPITVAILTFIIGMFAIKERKTTEGWIEEDDLASSTS